MKDKNVENFIRHNSPDGGFLQSDAWRKFQESVGRKTFSFSSENFHANIIEHLLPVVGKYFYVPRGPVVSHSLHPATRSQILEVVSLAKNEDVGWIRFDANSEEVLEYIRKNIKYKITKAPHDVQPKELFVIDIAKPEDKLLSGMKSKTRYNIKLAEKKDLKIFETREEKYLDEFLRLVKITAERDGITPHPENYYQKMFETVPAENLKLYIAEYAGKIIAANLVLFYGETATYLHGASGDEFRNLMAPYLLQWRQIQDAKAAGCTRYDFGGVSLSDKTGWGGITRFKTGFSPETRTLEFPGSYDIVIDPIRYYTYRVIQKVKSIIR